MDSRKTVLTSGVYLVYKVRLTDLHTFIPSGHFQLQNINQSLNILQTHFPKILKNLQSFTIFLVFAFGSFLAYSRPARSLDIMALC